jgi:hypothetical protein
MLRRRRRRRLLAALTAVAVVGVVGAWAAGRWWPGRVHTGSAAAHGVTILRYTIHSHYEGLSERSRAERTVSRRPGRCARIAGPPARLTARIDHGIHDPATLSLAF